MSQVLADSIVFEENNGSEVDFEEFVVRIIIKKS